MRFNLRSTPAIPPGWPSSGGIRDRLPSEKVAGFESEWAADLLRNPRTNPRPVDEVPEARDHRHGGSAGPGQGATSPKARLSAS